VTRVAGVAIAEADGRFEGFDSKPTA